MLLIDLAELLRIVGKNIVVDINEFPRHDDDITYLEPVVGEITITNSGSLVLARGRVKTVVKMECGRCLIDIRVPIDAEIEEQYSLNEIEDSRYNDSHASLVADEENELPEGLMDGSVMDLNIVIRQGVILATPLSAYCSHDCKGLCFGCGRNLNDPNGSCECVPKIVNKPLAVLKTLLGTDEESAAENNGIGTSGTGAHHDASFVE